MTREEAIAYGKRVIDLGLNDEAQAFCELAIKALEERTEEGTETHECDYISRKFMYDMGATCIAARNKDGDLVALGALDILPSATPQPKTGRWIGHREYCEMNNLIPSGLGCYFWCSECNCGIDYKYFHLVNYNYCPKCGSYNGGAK